MHGALKSQRIKLSELFLLGVGGNNIKLTFNSQHLKMANSAKFLGIIFDNKLTWTDNINYIDGKCKSASTLCAV